MGAVLVGLDGSAESIAALRWAAWFATTTQRELHVAHSWQRGSKHGLLASTATGALDAEDLESAVCEALRGIVDQELDDASVVTDYRALRGDIATSLLAEADRDHGLLIVVGARGYGGARRAVLGSVSRRLTECPARTVVIVPDEVSIPEPGPWSIVVGIDGSTASSRAVRWAASVARHGGRVVAVHALELAELDMTRAERAATLEEMHRRLAEEWCAPLRAAGVAHEVRVDYGPAREVLARVAEQVRPVCVVAGSRGMGSLSQRLLGSVTHNLVRELDWPTVVVPAPRDRLVWTV